MTVETPHADRDGACAENLAQAMSMDLSPRESRHPSRWNAFGPFTAIMVKGICSLPQSMPRLSKS